MSFRQEERQKNNCPSRGFGLAAAAIGIGVGAAMYYFFSKRPENQHGEGSSSSEWEANTFGSDAENQSDMDIDSDDYTTVSENVTSDTSVYDNNNSSAGSIRSISDDSEEESLSEYSIDQGSETNSFSSDSSYSVFEDQQQITISIVNNSFETDYLTLGNTLNTSVSSSDSDIAMEWDVTNSSEGIPGYTTTRRPIRHVFGNIRTILSPRRSWNKITEEEQMNILRDQAFRERPWTAEECSICFEGIRREQEVMTLPCTHHFHQACILPWLQEQQTCPNCRKRIE